MRGSFVFTAWATILRDLSLVSLIFYFIWRNGESRRQLVRQFGLSQPTAPLPKFLTARDIPQFVLASVLEARPRRWCCRR